jgi:hypothetical protein
MLRSPGSASELRDWTTPEKGSAVSKRKQANDLFFSHCPLGRVVSLPHPVCFQVGLLWLRPTSFKHALAEYEIASGKEVAALALLSGFLGAAYLRTRTAEDTTVGYLF